MADIIIYNTADGKAEIKLYADNGTVWLTQAQIAELFTKNISTISRHIANIFDENEIEEVKIHPPSGWLLFFGHSPIFSSHT